MSVKTYIDHARTRVQTMQKTVDTKFDAFETFIDRVSTLPTEPSPLSASGITATTGTPVQTKTLGDDHARAIRTAFAETIRPHSVTDLDESGSLIETIQNEFTDSIAVALAPTTETSFSAALKQAIIAEATARRTETEVLRCALGREKTHLEAASETVDDITAWIAEADETPLTELGFESLQHRHETLTDHRTRCEEYAHQRQEFLQETTSQNVDAGIRHRDLISYLYEDFPVNYPVLATVTRLDATCKRCQRTVRAHLVRRV
jgi:hypothetical protein